MEEVLCYSQKSFKGDKNVISVFIEKRIFQKNQALPKSSYKLTWHINQEIHGKKLKKIPAGTISFISKVYGGAAYDRYITETPSTVEKLLFDDI